MMKIKLPKVNGVLGFPSCYFMGILTYSSSATMPVRIVIALIEIKVSKILATLQVRHISHLGY